MAALLAGAAAACTLKVDVPRPEITVECVEILLPGGQTSTACPEAGTDADLDGD